MRFVCFGQNYWIAMYLQPQNMEDLDKRKKMTHRRKCDRENIHKKVPVQRQRLVIKNTEESPCHMVHLTEICNKKH